MKARPILFSGPMVRANRAGAKTQTRRPMKPQPDLTPEWCYSEQIVEYYAADERVYWEPCPYGQSGDLLWVRETWSLPSILDGLKPSAPALGPSSRGVVRYLADGLRGSGKTRVSIHMPRWASRTTLRILEVGVERLGGISNADAIAEGVETLDIPETPQGGLALFPVAKYATLWDSINGAGSWGLNPWVWVILYEVIAQNIDEYLEAHSGALGGPGAGAPLPTPGVPIAPLASAGFAERGK